MNVESVLLAFPVSTWQQAGIQGLFLYRYADVF